MAACCPFFLLRPEEPVIDLSRRHLCWPECPRLEWKPDDEVALKREHDKDREEQGDECKRADSGKELRPIPLFTLGANEDEAGQRTGKKRNAEIDEHAVSDLTDADVDGRAPEAEPRWKDGDENPRIEAVEDD